MKKPLSEYVEYIARGVSPKYDLHGIPVINQKCIRDYKIDISLARITNNKLKKVTKEKLIKKYDVLVNSTGVGTLGRVAQILDLSEPTTVDSHVTIVRPILDKIDGLFFGHCLKACQTQIEDMGVGATGQTELSKHRLLEEISIYSHSISSQRKIAGILSAYDDLIENNNKRIKVLEEMAQKLYKEWFVDFKFPNHENTKIVESELGLIPEGWAVGRVIDCCSKIQNGGTPKRSKPEYWENATIPWLASGEVRQNIIIDTKEYISELGLKESSAKLLPKYVTIVALYGATAGQVAFTVTELTTNQAVSALFPKKNYTYFNYLFLQSISEALVGKATGAAQQNISKAIVEQFEVVMPNIELLSNFEENMKPVFKLWESLYKKNGNLRKTRDMLLPRLISGELSVKNLDNLEAAA